MRHDMVQFGGAIVVLVIVVLMLAAIVVPLCVRFDRKRRARIWKNSPIYVAPYTVAVWKGGEAPIVELANCAVGLLVVKALREDLHRRIARTMFQEFHDLAAYEDWERDQRQGVAP